MKLALITDTHWGVRGDHRAFHDNNKRFLDGVFFPTLERWNIQDVVHLGDLLDHRKYCSILTANRLRTDFIDPMGRRGIHYYQIIGNHDTFFKNTNEVNSFSELYGLYPFVWYEEAKEVDFGGTKILFVPWICDDNRTLALSLIKDTDAQVCFGHLNISGFQMYKSSIPSDGDDPNTFSKFDVVCSGHFHHRSSSGNIHYLGAHAEFTWSDYDDPRGFHIFDTDTRELTFIENPYKMFYKVFYSDLNEEDLNVDFGQYKDTVVKVVVKEKTNPFFFDKFIENLERVNPVSLQIVEDHLNLDIEDDQHIVEDAQSTVDIFKNYIETIDVRVDKRKLEKKVIEIYNEASTLE